jgi:hypothetical protein
MADDQIADALRDLETRFWAWRTATVPDSTDDIARVERPPGWTPDWSGGAVAARRATLDEFHAGYQALDLSGQPVGVQVNGRLLGCALARVHWELNLVGAWRTNPCFYLDQSLGAVYPLLLVPPPFDDARAAAVVARLAAVPAVLAQGRANLAGNAVAGFARAALDLLDHAPDDLRTAMGALAPLLPEQRRTALAGAAAEAAAALEVYRDWLAAELPRCPDVTAVGPAAFAFFVHRVALLPYPIEEIRAIGRQEWDRAVATEAALARRYRDLPPPALPADTAAQVDRQAGDERRVRGFYAGHGILSQPDSLRHYRFAPIPDYVAPLSWLGVEDDLTSPSRIDQDAVRYVPPPEPGLPYFARAAAADPRLVIAHEGVHAQQLALSWAHPDPARRHYYDSVPNEGIAFYNEELMLVSGLFDGAPHSALAIASFLRLRALRVEVDVALALGEFDVDAAGRYLEDAVPMDAATAREEAVFFAGNPGQGMSYLVGKRQVLALLADAARRDGFALDAFHDRLWREGNVPLALQHWELLGSRDDLDRADDLAETEGAPW